MSAAFDYAQLSDEELDALAGDAPAPTAAAGAPAFDYAQLSDEELEQLAGPDEASGGVLQTISEGVAEGPTSLALRAGNAISERLPYHEERTAFGRHAIDALSSNYSSEFAGAAAAVRSVPRQLAEATGLVEEGPDLIDTYRGGRDSAQAELERLHESSPIASRAGTVTGVAGPLLASGGATLLARVPGALKAAPGAALRLATPTGMRAAWESTKAVAPAAARQAVRTAPVGAAVGAVAAGGASDADLTRGEFGEFGEDLAEGAAWGAGAGAVLGAGGAVMERNATQAATVARGKVPRAERYDAFDEARTAHPARVAETEAANQAGRAKYASDVDDVKTANFEGREQYRNDVEDVRATNYQGRQQHGERQAARDLEVQTAREEAAARQAQLEAEALAESRVPSEENAAAIFGLDDAAGARRFGGDPVRARERSRQLLTEQLDDETPLVQEYLGREPEARVSWAREGKSTKGAEIGGFRNGLEHVDGAWVDAPPLKTSMRRALVDVPDELRPALIEKFYTKIDQVAQHKRVAPKPLRGMVEDVEKMIDAATDKVTRRALQKVRKVLVDREKQLIHRHFPVEAPQYDEAMRQFGVYSDVEFGASKLLKRAKPGQDPIRYGKPREVPREQPREVPELEPFQPQPAPAKFRPQQPPPKFQPQAAPEKPTYPGGPELEAADLDALTPEGIGRLGRGVAGMAGTVVGAPLGKFGRALGREAAYSAVDWMNQARAAQRMNAPEARAAADAAEAALARFRPALEQAMQSGPEAVARTHASLMRSEPTYAAVFAEKGDERQAPDRGREDLAMQERVHMRRIESEAQLERERMRLNIGGERQERPTKRSRSIKRDAKGRLEYIDNADRRIRQHVIRDEEGRVTGIEEEDL